jgi:lipopolysaccharide biosynthesis glycosyltransferase
VGAPFVVTVGFDESASHYHFAFAAQGNYSLQLATTVAGLLEHLDAGSVATTLWVLDLDAEPQTRARVERVVRRHASGRVNLKWLRISGADFGNIETAGHLVPVTYARLLLPLLLPSEVKTVVYLDADLVVSDDLSELNRLWLGSLPVAAVPDYAVQVVGSARSGIAGLSAKPADATYFNAGVLVMNLACWRTTRLAEEVMRFAAAHAPLKHNDQDALNAVLTEWHELPLRWNVQSSIHWLDRPLHSDFELKLKCERELLLGSGAIMHFSGPSKPWEPWYRSPDAKLWRQALWRSGALTGSELARWSLGHYPKRSVARLTIVTVRKLRAALVSRASSSL